MYETALPPLFEGEPFRKAWEEGRRQEILTLLSDQVYGFAPGPDQYKIRFEQIGQEDFKGIATRRMVEATLHTAREDFRFRFVVFLPHGVARPLPLALMICIRVLGRPMDVEHLHEIPSWPVEEILARGYATAGFYTQDIALDREDGYFEGILKSFEGEEKDRPANAWGAIAAWAFAASRVMDYLQTLPEVDPARIAVAGLSRGGKAALWCAANDTRFACVDSNESGCTGAAITRGKQGEHVKEINTTFPYWFCKNYKAYNEREDEMPFDQHMLLSLIAPRLLYVSSASEDSWADPEAEYRGAYEAGAVYALYGLKGLEQRQMPGIDQPCHENAVGYHLRAGEHDMTPHDWAFFMDFLDCHWTKD